MTSELASLLFVWVLLNQAGVPLPVVPSLLAAGALAHSRTGLLVPVLATVAGTLVADLVWYGLGRWRGPQALALLGRLSRRAEESHRGRHGGGDAHRARALHAHCDHERGRLGPGVDERRVRARPRHGPDADGVRLPDDARTPGGGDPGGVSGGVSGGETPAARPRNGRPPRWASSAVTPSGPLSGYGFQNILLATSQ